MPRLSAYGTKDRDTTTLRLEDIAGDEVIIRDCDIRTGNFGDFAVITVERDQGELIPVVTGGLFVVDALKDAMAKDAFPVNVRFFRRGRTWMFE